MGLNEKSRRKLQFLTNKAAPKAPLLRGLWVLHCIWLPYNNVY